VGAPETTIALADDAPGLIKGQSVPDFELSLLDQETRFSQEDLRGKVSLVAFWASWCGPCRRELPALELVHKELSSQGFQVVAINVDRNPALARKFLGGHPPAYPVVLDPESQLMGHFDVVAMPTSVLVDPTLAVVSRHEGYSEERLVTVREEIDSLLAGVGVLQGPQ
jgi:thiol-disulfide isomerase/thioredoxin